jgi:hypothetical protein
MATTTTNQMNYPSDTAATITLASLASSSTWVAGQESNSIDNTSNLYLDYMISGLITVGTSPTANTQIRIYVFSTVGASDDWPDVFDGVNSVETITSVGVGEGFLKPVKFLNVDATTSDRGYPFGQVSLAECFGGWPPRLFGFFVTQNTGAALNATAGNHYIVTQPILTVGNTP